MTPDHPPARLLRIAVSMDGASIRGSERQVLLLVRALLERGHEVVASCRRDGPVAAELHRLGVRTTGARPRGDVDLASALRFAWWLRRERPDVLLATSWKRILAASWAARVAGVPRTVVRNGALQHLPNGPLGEWKYRKPLTDWVDAMIVNSVGLRDHALTAMPWIDPESIHLVPNAVGAEAAPAGGIRGEIGVPEDAVLVAGVGGLEVRKGFALTIGAIARLADPAIHLAIAGSGPLGAELATRAADLGVADRVHLLGQRGDVPALLAASDVFVLSSREDSAPNVVLEAMQAGALVIATDVPGMREVIGSNGGEPAGWIVPVDDEEALAATLREVVAGIRARAPEVEARRAEARARLRDRFGIATTVLAAEAALLGEPPLHRRSPAEG